MPTILHFADAHIDMANYGRHDPQTGLPLRVMDFLKSLDEIVATAIDEQVDLVLFAGDAYKDRNPAPTFQREWGRRLMRLSHAGIPVLLLIGNHDLSPALGRAHALDVFDTLEVPNIFVIDKPALLGPENLGGVPLQIIALPWISRSGMIAHLGMNSTQPNQLYTELEERLTSLVNQWIEVADPDLPLIFTAHASVQGAKYGGERTVMLGNDLVLPGSLVKNPRLNYVALGHIHKAQDLNEGLQPPVIYPGSIERVDFGEADDKKFFVVAQVERKKTRVDWRELAHIRPFVSCYLNLTSQENITEKIRAVLPAKEKMNGIILRLTLEYPREWESLIDEQALRAETDGVFEFHLVKRPQMDTRIRLAEDQSLGSLSPLDLLNIYWRSNHIEGDEMEILARLAHEVITSPE